MSGERKFLELTNLSKLSKMVQVSESSLKRYRNHPSQMRLSTFIDIVKVEGWSEAKILEFIRTL